MDTQLAAMEGGESSAAVSETAYAFPVTFAQQRLWFLDRLQPGNTSYSVPWAIRMNGRLDVEALELSLNEIIRRHEILRTTFSVLDSEPVQVVSESANLRLPVIDISQSSDPVQEARRRALEEAELPFDLETGPLVRGQLLHLAATDHVLLLTLHHIIFDGWSRRIFADELAHLYQAYSEGRQPALPDLRLQYADYAVWQRNYLQGENLEKQLAYWKKQLADVPATMPLPADRPRPAVQTSNGALETFTLPKALSDKLNAFSREQGATLFMTLLAALQGLLVRYSGQTDVVLGTPIANRNRVEIESLIGLFANTLVLRTDLSGDPTFAEAVSRVKDMALAAYAHQDIPFEKLVEELQPERSLSYNPIVQVVFALQNAPRQAFHLPGLELNWLDGAGGTTAKFDISLFVTETPAGLFGRIEYNTDLFDQATMARMAKHFEILLEAAAANPSLHLSELPLLTPEEQHRLLVDWNSTASAYPRDACIHDLFEEQADRTPDQIALLFEQQRLTYSELNQRANQLAHRLRSLGVGPDTLVGICLDRSLDLIVSTLAVIKAGGAYLPLDSAYPKDRLAFMLADAEARVLITDSHLSAGLPRHQAAEILLDRDAPAIARESTRNLSSSTRADHLAYVLYTSGSTGKPKGVEVPHRAVVRLVRNTNYITLDASETLLQLAPISFDASTLEIWGALLNGAKLVIYPARTPTFADLAAVIRDRGITTLWLTSSLFHEMVDSQIESLSGLRQLLAGGDVLSVPHVRKALVHLTNGRVINGYGPTENTTFTCCYPMTGATEIAGSVPIGKPISNTQVYILDRRRRLVPEGIAGELYIGGDGLARQYLNRQELTAERFVANPFSPDPAARLYKTGDLVRYLPDGNIQFLGRIDQQVKLRGFRIELGEIEATLDAHPGVRQSVVMAREDVPGMKQLVAYVVPQPGASIQPAELRQYVRQSLPEFMIPAAVVMLDALPVTPNGKVNRQLLPAPAGLTASLEPEGEPADPLEMRLASVWEAVLAIKGVRSNDNFFDCGGHSLTAVKLLAEIEKVFSVKLPLAALFQAPTLAQMAGLIREDASKHPLPILCPIHAGGTLPPLFCVSRPNVNALGYVFLSRHIGADQPVYGLQAHLRDPNLEPFTQVEYERTAAEYIAAMRQVQPHGPYFLTGHCEGAHIAFEMARQLERAGEPIGMLAILDAWPQENTRNRLLFYLHLHVRRSREFLRYSRGERWTAIRSKLASIWPWRTASRVAASPAKPAYFQRMKKRYWPGSGYVPLRCEGPITLFRVSRQHFWRIKDRYMGWRERTHSGVMVVDVPGEHSLILREPAVSKVAERMAVTIRTIAGKSAAQKEQAARECTV